MDNLTSLLQAVGPVSVNAEVRGKMLELIQAWAAATEGRHELSYIGEVYRTMQREGYQFPPRQTVSSSMIDSSAVSITRMRATYEPLTLLEPHSPPNGPTQTCACDAELLLPSRIENTIAETAEIALTSNVQPNPSLFHISAFTLRFELTMAAMRSSQERDIKSWIAPRLTPTNIGAHLLCSHGMRVSMMDSTRT